jgi:hypothetical protein
MYEIENAPKSTTHQEHTQILRQSKLHEISSQQWTIPIFLDAFDTNILSLILQKTLQSKDILRRVNAQYSPDVISLTNGN